VIMVERIRSTAARTQHERHYSLSSLPPKKVFFNSGSPR
jgi:hypothetical protein